MASIGFLIRGALVNAYHSQAVIICLVVYLKNQLISYRRFTKSSNRMG